MSNRYGEQDHLPIEFDDEDVEKSPMLSDDANSEVQLDRDEDEAIDQSNIIPGDGLRHAKPQAQKQYEGPDENDLLI